MLLRYILGAMRSDFPCQLQMKTAPEGAVFSYAMLRLRGVFWLGAEKLVLTIIVVGMLHKCVQ